LRLPLFGPNEPGRRQPRQNFFGARRTAKQLVERTSGRYPLAAFAGQNDRSPFLHDARGRAHPFDALIQIQVERESAVGCYYNVKRRLDLLHRRLPDELATGLVRGEQVAGKDAGDLFLFVEADVKQKAGTHPQGDIAQLLPQRIAFRNAKGGARMADIFRGRIIDVTERTYTIELTGNTAKIDAFIRAIDRASILETVRTGSSGIGRGEKVLRV